MGKDASTSGIGNVIGGVIGDSFIPSLDTISQNKLFKDFMSGKGASIEEIDSFTKNITAVATDMADQNHDGKITREEFDAVLKLLPERDTKKVAEQTERFFKDGKSVSIDELKLQRAAFIENLAKIDENGDGRIDQSEVKIPLDGMIASVKNLQTPEMINYISGSSGLSKEEVVEILSPIQGKMKAGDVNHDDKLSVKELIKVAGEIMKEISDSVSAQSAGTPQNGSLQLGN